MRRLLSSLLIILLSTCSLTHSLDEGNSDSMFFRQFQTVDDVPKAYFKTQKTIYAYCERVIDGDTIRVRHIPSYAWIRRTPSPLQKRALSDCTLSIRIYGVDTPEIAKNKNQCSQPYGDEAKDFTTSQTLHKMLRITFLRKDQYHRAVCVVETLGWCRWPWAFPRDLSVSLAQEGLAELYTGGGAEYYNNRALLEAKIAGAQSKKRGMWSLGSQRISAADHKRGVTAKNVPALAAARGGAQEAEAGRSGKSKAKNQGRGSSVLESAMTGLELVG